MRASLITNMHYLLLKKIFSTNYSIADAVAEDDDDVNLHIRYPILLPRPSTLPIPYFIIFGYLSRLFFSSFRVFFSPSNILFGLSF